MALPNSRNRTYVDGVTVIEAEDLNDLQDEIIALNYYTGKTRVYGGWSAFAENGNPNIDLANGVTCLQSGNDEAVIPLPGLVVGEEIKEVRVRCLNGLTGTGKILRLVSYDEAGSATEHASSTPSDIGASLETETWSGLSVSVDEGHRYGIHVDANVATGGSWIIVISAAVDTDFPNPSP